MELPTLLGVPPASVCVFVIVYCRYHVESVCDVVALCHGGQCHLLPCCPVFCLKMQTSLLACMNRLTKSLLGLFCSCCLCWQMNSWFSKRIIICMFQRNTSAHLSLIIHRIILWTSKENLHELVFAWVKHIFYLFLGNHMLISEISRF